ncbi:MAG: Hrp-dependent type III effector protein [Methylorubrum populi]
MTCLRLIADDLTGTLDAAAGFSGLCGPIPVAWPEGLAGAAAGSLAVDTGTRERDADAAAAIAGGLAPLLGSADIAFKKVDSLLRGPWAAELAAVLRAGGWERCVVAPAFPYQGRATVGGRQVDRSGATWTPVCGDIAGALQEVGLPARHAAVEDGPVPGVAVYDASDDAELHRIAALGGDPGRVLWCGSGGLAAALARGTPPTDDARLVGPVLGLFGSDRAESEAQLAACGDHRLLLPHDGADATPVAARLTAGGVALVSLHLPPGTAREAAAVRIAARFSGLVAGLGRPGTLLVAGGETLKALCLALGAGGLDVTGQVAPGLPRSTLRGGRWDGLPVVSKSGAFGTAGVWRDLLHHNGFIPDRRDA